MSDRWSEPDATEEDVIGVGRSNAETAWDQRHEYKDLQAAKDAYLDNAYDTLEEPRFDSVPARHHCFLVEKGFNEVWDFYTKENKL